METESHSPEAVASYSSSSTGGDCQQQQQQQQQHVSSGAVTKRKRTKRLRAFPSPQYAEEEEGYLSTTTVTTEEEEDMANCLILLAQGRTFGSSSPREEKFTSRKFAETMTTAGAKAGFYVYECKTCNKCFPSFQALGGHRASHKKPRLAGNTTESAAANNSIDHDNLEISMNSFGKSTSNILASAGSNNKFRVHECSICGSEFASGQALGGHMRRHRPVGPPVAASGSPEADNMNIKKEKEKKVGMLSLDLNLPAPSEETVTFAFSDQRPVGFSSAAAALVDCHY